MVTVYIGRSTKLTLCWIWNRCHLLYTEHLWIHVAHLFGKEIYTVTSSQVVSPNDNKGEIWIPQFILLFVYRELWTSGGRQEETSPQEAAFWGTNHPLPFSPDASGLSLSPKRGKCRCWRVCTISCYLTNTFADKLQISLNQYIALHILCLCQVISGQVENNILFLMHFNPFQSRVHPNIMLNLCKNLIFVILPFFQGWIRMFLRLHHRIPPHLPSSLLVACAPGPI